MASLEPSVVKPEPIVVDLTDDLNDLPALHDLIFPQIETTLKQEPDDDQEQITPIADTTTFEGHTVEQQLQIQEPSSVTLEPMQDVIVTSGEIPKLNLSNQDDVDMDALEALRLYNENKANFDDDDDNQAKHSHDIVGSFNDPDPAKGQVDVLDWNTELDIDPAADSAFKEAAFARLKANYEQKKADGTATVTDDIAFAAANSAEKKRLADLERSQLVLEDEPEPVESNSIEDSLFIPEVPALPEGSQKKPRATAKGRNRINAAELREVRRVEESSRKGKRKAPGSNQERQPRKRPDTGLSSGKPVPRKGRKRPNLSNIQSLGKSNIVQEAQANASRPDVPTFTSKNKDKALQELLASIPSSDRGTHTCDKTALREATRKFKGHGSVRADGQGGWKLRGMESSLYHHQLLGAAFLRDRERSDTKPKGGLICDEMGFGKTIQMIANILDGKPEDPNDPVKTTLVIAPPSLLNQWMSEMIKHVEGNRLGRILRYHAGARLCTNDVIADLMSYDVILTTYGEVRNSYPMVDAPKHLCSETKKNEWWAKWYTQRAGPLHKIKFHRIVLDEAHHIKNYTSKTSIAVRTLTGNFRWCITGTPILNYIEELFPYFDFLKVPHTGDYATFCHNYCDNRMNREPVNMGRLHNILRSIMLRRTHVDTLFNAPIVKLPGISHTTHLVEFSEVEKHIYNMVRSRYIRQINVYSRSGELVANYRSILGMLIRLRMLCSHILLAQDTLKQMLVASDIEKLWSLTAKEVEADKSQQNQIVVLRDMITSRSNVIKTCQSKEMDESGTTTAEVGSEGNMSSGHQFGLYFKFRRFLRNLAESKNWAELHLRSVCSKCRLPPDDPVCTSCFHVYCSECINSMKCEPKLEGEKIACIECGAHFTETSPCSGLLELGFNSTETKKKAEKLKNKTRKRSSSSLRRNSQASNEESENEEKDDDWIELSGVTLSSAKLQATKAAILNWRDRSPNEKILVYTQFLGLSRILSKVCSAEGWGHVLFNGKMTMEAREKAIGRFRDEPDIFIMIASLKAGGVGLNLNMASKVIILDLWFNSSIEAQAYCRAFRIGQERKVEVLRFVVKNSIDEDLVQMQNRKDIEVTGAIGPESLSKRATIKQLLELFGEVREEGQNEFILVEDERHDQNDADVDMIDKLPPPPF